MDRQPRKSLAKAKATANWELAAKEQIMIQRSPQSTGLVDYETYRELVKDGEKADLIDGVIYMASPDTKLSNTLNGFIFQLLSGYFDAKEIDGFVFSVAFRAKFRSSELLNRM
jgi:hypothetical protein